MHESLSELHYTAPSIYDRKVRAISTTFTSNRGQLFDIMDYMKFNIYSPAVMENKVLSPLNPKAKVHYYYLLDSVSHRLGGDWYKIKIIPRYNSTQLLDGYLWVSSADWSIRYLDVHGKYDLIRFHLFMQMGNTEETRCLPTLLYLDLDFRFLKIILR